jgi:thioesterase domain-containing protein/acyl carrier protein
MRVPFVAPRNEVEREIALLCAEILGVDRVGVHDDFLDLGADSLITLRITDRVRQALGREVPPHAAFRGSTVERMARAIRGEADTRAASPIVPIQPGGSRRPLFFVHPAAGVVFPYVELSRELGPDQPFYGLQARGLDGREPPDAEVEDMARHYLAAMRAEHPRGPYLIGGFSFGCLVAYEMALQLAREGEPPALVALVDEPAPVDGYRPSAALMAKLMATGVARTIWPHLHDYFYLRNASHSRAERAAEGLRRFAKIRPDGALLTSFLARSAMANFVPPESRLLALRQPAIVPMFELFMLHMKETIEYEPPAYPHALTVFRATRFAGKRGKDPTMGWRMLAAGGVEVHEIPGEHLTLLRRPHVQVLGAKLSACLDAAEARINRR